MKRCDTDVAVIGAGFAGVTVARELAQRGHRVTVLEARDRLGGRTWMRPSPLGRELELGGTWVHWIQPFVWAEIARYGLKLVASPAPESVVISGGGKAREEPADRLFELLDDALMEFLAGSRDLLPQPYDFHPLSDDLKRLDAVSVTDRIVELNLDDDTAALLRAFWALNFNGDPEDSAYTQALRWAALSAGDWKLLFEACSTYKLVKGTRALVEAIAADAKGAEFHFDTTVSAVDDSGDIAVVTLSDGRTITARRVVVTVPIGALNSISFTPPLARDLQAVADEGQASRGIKVWARIRGEVKPFGALAADIDSAFTFLLYEYAIDGDSLVVAFGPESGRLDATNPRAVEAELRKWRPEIEVVAVDSHDWTDDPLSRQTWPMLRPNQLNAVLSAAGGTDRAVRLLGSDYARGWAGFIDGAIESGLAGARQIINEFESSTATTQGES